MSGEFGNNKEEYRRKYGSWLWMFCAAFYLSYALIVMPKAEPPMVAFLFAAIYFPTTVVTTIVELICLSDPRKVIELLGLVLDIVLTVLISGYWIMMVLVGGTGLLAQAILSIGVNALVLGALGVKLKKF